MASRPGRGEPLPSAGSEARGRRRAPSGAIRGRRRRGRRWLLAASLTPLAAGLAPVPAAPAPPEAAREEAAAARAAGGVFGGFTAQRWPVVLTLSRSGRRITVAAAAIEARCAAGGETVLPESYRAVRVGRSGAFRESFRDAFRNEGQLFEVAGSLRGRFNRARTRVRGAWRVQFAVEDLATRAVDRCDSGPVGFSVRE